jgi:hypothetical protein
MTGISMVELLGLIVAVGNVVATIGIALALSRASNRMGQLELEHNVKDAWVGLDYHALTNGGDLQLMDELFYPGLTDEPIEVKRKRWLCHAIRHPLEIMFATIQAGLVDDRTQATASLSATLRHLVMSNMFLAQVEEFSPDNGFIDLCHRLRREAEEMTGEPELDRAILGRLTPVA